MWMMPASLVVVRRLYWCAIGMNDFWRSLAMIEYTYISCPCVSIPFLSTRFFPFTFSWHLENRHAFSEKVSPHWCTAYSSNGTALWIIISSEYSILVRTSICTYTSESGELNLIVATKHRTTESSIEEGAQTISPFNKHTHIAQSLVPGFDSQLINMSCLKIDYVLHTHHPATLP